MPILTLPAEMALMPQMVAFVAECAQQHGFSGKRLMEIELAAEEALVNVIHYAYPDQAPGPVTITCESDGCGQFVIQIEDQGVAFDLTQLADPDLTSDIAERQVGGLGVYLIFKLMDSVSYCRKTGHNLLKLAVSSPSPAAPAAG